jgi:hypothetical protein
VSPFWIRAKDPIWKIKAKRTRAVALVKCLPSKYSWGPEFKPSITKTHGTLCIHSCAPWLLACFAGVYHRVYALHDKMHWFPKDCGCSRLLFLGSFPVNCSSFRGFCYHCSLASQTFSSSGPLLTWEPGFQVHGGPGNTHLFSSSSDLHTVMVPNPAHHFLPSDGTRLLGVNRGLQSWLCSWPGLVPQCRCAPGLQRWPSALVS